MLRLKIYIELPPNIFTYIYVSLFQDKTKKPHNSAIVNFSGGLCFYMTRDHSSNPLGIFTGSRLFHHLVPTCSLKFMIDVGTYFIHVAFGKGLWLGSHKNCPESRQKSRRNPAVEVKLNNNMLETLILVNKIWWKGGTRVDFDDEVGMFIKQLISSSFIFGTFIWTWSWMLFYQVDVDHVCIFRTYSLGCSNPTYPGFVCLLQMSWFSWALDSWDKMSTVIMVVTSQHPGCLEDHPRLGSGWEPTFISHEQAIWKGKNPILRWLIKLLTKWDDPPSEGVKPK